MRPVRTNCCEKRPTTDCAVFHHRTGRKAGIILWPLVFIHSFLHHHRHYQIIIIIILLLLLLCFIIIIYIIIIIYLFNIIFLQQHIVLHSTQDIINVVIYIIFILVYR